jgi:hypothetical protein
VAQSMRGMDSIEANDGICDIEELCRRCVMVEADRGAFAMTIGVMSMRGKSSDAKSRLWNYLEGVTPDCTFSSAVYACVSSS